MVDEERLEKLVDERNVRWRRAFAREPERANLSVPVITRKPLPPEKGRMKRPMPILYWGV
jgi:hypothetical protein